MDRNKEIELNTPNLLVKYRHLVNAAINKGVREALLKHKLAGNPVAIGRDGKVVIIKPEDIEIL